MKKLVLFLMMLGFFGFVNPQQVFSQNNGIILDLNDDTVSADQMDPQFFYAEEDEAGSESSTTTIALIIGAVVVVGGVAFFLLRKKK